MIGSGLKCRKLSYKPRLCKLIIQARSSGKKPELFYGDRIYAISIALWQIVIITLKMSDGSLFQIQYISRKHHQRNSYLKL